MFYFLYVYVIIHVYLAFYVHFTVLFIFSCIVNSGVSRISLKEPKYILPSVPFPMSLLVSFIPFFKPSLPFLLIHSLYVNSPLSFIEVYGWSLQCLGPEVLLLQFLEN